MNNISISATPSNGTIHTERKYTIYTAKKRTSPRWKERVLTEDELIKLLSNFVTTDETLAQYLGMSKAEQGNIKDVGGFVGGKLRDGKRSRLNVEFRSLLTYDFDHLEEPAQYLWDKITKLFPNILMLMYSTHSYTYIKPCLRLVIFLDRDVLPEQYEPLSRKTAEAFIELLDKTTHDVERLFYFPSKPVGAQEFLRVQRGCPLSVDEVLSYYENWRDVASWPRAKSETKIALPSNEALSDPRKKPGIIGAFCRAYTIEDAIDAFIPECYKPGDKGRYSYVESHTANGLVIYNKVHAHSFHNSDPAGGKTCNAFDLVRIHLFGSEDNGKEYKNITLAPSYSKMVELCKTDTLVLDELKKWAESEREKDLQYLAQCAKQCDEENSLSQERWEALLRQLSENNKVERTIDNIVLIMEHDVSLKGNIVLDDFSHKVKANNKVPWMSSSQEGNSVKANDVWHKWGNNDWAGLRHFLEVEYHIKTCKNEAKDALGVFTQRHAVNPLKEFFSSLKWDGVPRLETSIIEFVGAENTPLHRAITRKHFVAAVSRVFEPGCKYDYCLTLTGGEGVGKTSFFALMGGKYFTNSLYTFEGKEAMEQIQGFLLIELGEIAAVYKSRGEQVKNFLSKEVDSLRGAYKEETEEYPRQCVFCATTNERYFLKGSDGNRRFLIIPVDRARWSKYESTSLMREELKKVVPQLWAEAVHYYKEGETLYLDGELEKEAKKAQEAHNVRADNDFFTQLDNFLEMPLPKNWNTYELADRQKFWEEQRKQDDSLRVVGTVPRTKFCAREYLVEFLQMDALRDDFINKVREVNKWMALKTDDWESVSSSKHAVLVHGTQRAFVRIAKPSNTNGISSQLSGAESDIDDEDL